MLYEILAVTILVFIFYFIIVQETFISCRECNKYYINPHMSSIVNPYKWPYSGSPCVDDVNLMNMTNEATLTHLNTSDHVELVN